MHMHLPMLESSYVAWITRVLTGRGSVSTYHCDLLLPEAPLASAISGVLTTSHHLAAMQSDAWSPIRRTTPAIRASSGVTRRRLRPSIHQSSSIHRIERQQRDGGPTLGLDGCKIVGFAGRFSEDKGGNYLLASIPEVAAAVPTVKIPVCR